MSTISLSIQSDSAVVKPSGWAIGMTAFGGKIGYIYKPGDPEFVAGQIKGVIISNDRNEVLGNTWTNAFNFADTYVVGPYSDWRMPTAKELDTYFFTN